MRSSLSTLLPRALLCSAFLTALGFAASASAHATTPVVKGLCPSADVALTATNNDQIRGSMCLANTERTARDLSPLRENHKLHNAAQGHSSDMVRRSYFAHTAPSGATFVDRIVRAGYTARGDGWSLGENLAWGTGDLGTARGIHTAWMRSSGHRANILKPAYREVGIGIQAGIPKDAGVGATFTADFGVTL
ncbi:CAP domain-containing protein [Solirubrobacter sp. CPCC 204708]|uniref:CAP domain-containing protein n=1 Tax=Solirubrobacter deserti TaxID=2282478 RepID=A0ABT4RQJ1_9ACTN|nr:CAP domain-containing protein [Solirubrobacter deserti]MBE2320541.1 CAP domain-containing protein [Solirubrobacter deserti]MDA0140831.1 CAP domain-containing protein [Solirubrobacter deserti]